MSAVRKPLSSRRQRGMWTRYWRRCRLNTTKRRLTQKPVAQIGHSDSPRLPEPVGGQQNEGRQAGRDGQGDGVVGVGHAETFGHACEELFLARMQRIVGLGDVEQAVERLPRHVVVEIEQVGGQLRAMMPWIGKNKLVDKAKN